MKFSPRRVATGAALCLAALASQPALAQSPACQVTYTKSWEGGNGFGANIVVSGDTVLVGQSQVG